MSIKHCILIPLDTDSSHPAQSQRRDQTHDHHPGEHGPKDGAVALHQGAGRRLVGVPRSRRNGRRDDRGHGQPDRRAQLCARVEHGAAQGLHVRREHVRDHEQADGEEDIGAQRCENLFR